MSDTPLPDDPTLAKRRQWFLRGIAGAFSIPGLILCSAFVGFAGLAKDSGFSIVQTVFMVAVVWALPAKVVLIGAINSGSSLVGTAIAVSLSSVRLMPMVVALTPEMRTPRTPSWVLYGLSHFVAVTSWVLALQNFAQVPREMRTTYYAGLGSTLIVANMIVVTVVFFIAEGLPPAVSAGLFLLTPMYFLTSLWGSAREKATYAAMIFGLGLGPLFHLLVPGFDLLAAGIVGGLLAYAVHRVLWRRRAA